MHRRAVAAVAAILLAVVGSIVLAGYVAASDERAMAGLDPVTVLVVTGRIAEGTPVEQIGDLVTAESVPAAAASPDSVTSLDQLDGQVAATQLLPGEQLLTHRFVAPDEPAESTALEVPSGMHQVTLLLDPTRVMGGHLSAGDTVGVFVSAEPEPRATRLLLQKVLVTRVQGGIAAPATAEPAAPEEAAAGPAPEPAPAEQVMVTLALDASGAEKLVFAAEYERIWLSLADAEAPEAESPTVTREHLFP